MLLTFRVPAGFHNIFAEGCFDEQIGKKINTENFGKAKLVKAEIVDDGRAALLTIDTNKSLKSHVGHHPREADW